MTKKKLKKEFIGTTEIYIGDNLVKCEITRNEKGNLEINHDSLDVCPNGTCSEMYDAELTIYPYNG